ncbi:MAG TPA: beta-ketoacyl-ACP synthase III [Rhodothermales bacterium]|nr:beta-ketoacyl-ACP synthase III [Rhodothermales bacterium]
MIHAAITAVGHYLPEERLTNADLERMVDTSDEWIRTRTGIRERRILRDPEKATSYMAAEAAKELLDKRGIDPAEIDVIIVATVTPDMLFPATACLVQTAIGATNAWGFDLSAACSGFLFALSTGARFIESGRYKRVLVIGADKMSSIIDYTDRNTCILFGDGAGAVLLEPDEKGYGIIDSVEHTDARNWELLCMPAGGSLHPSSHQTIDEHMHFLKQEGKSVFKLAVEGMSNVTAEIMQRNDLTGEDIKYLVPHQANMRIIDATARYAGIDTDKITTNISRYGNTTAATIPLCLHDWESELNRGDNVILAAFGGGFTWGAAYVRWTYDGAEVARTTLADVSEAVEAF